jgi:hypothetical protein
MAETDPQLPHLPQRQSPAPAFARDFPAHPGIDSLVDAFVRGDYARVRTEAPRLIDSSEPQDVRKAAGILLERTRPDPLAVVLLALTAVLLALLTVYWVVNGKAPASPLPHPPAIERVHS